MKTVWKFPMPSERCLIDMPVGAKVIRVAKQPPSDVNIWAIVESDNATEKRLFAAVGTGHAIPHSGRYLGTWDDGPFVWHLFEPVDYVPDGRAKHE